MPNSPRDAALSNTWKTLRPLCNKEQSENEKRRRKTKIMVGWKIEKEFRKKRAAKRLFMTNVTGLLLARFLVIFTQRCVLSGAPRAALCSIGLFLVRFWGFFFSKYGVAVFRVQACGNFKFYDAVIGEKIVVTRWSASFLLIKHDNYTNLWVPDKS